MTTLTPERIEDFARYRRKQIAELRPWVIGDDMSRVSVSAPDMAAGSPKDGDMIARNPKNHADQWLVAAQYFADNFEPVSAYDALSRDVGFDRIINLSPEDFDEFHRILEAPPEPNDKLVELLRGYTVISQQLPARDGMREALVRVLPWIKTYCHSDIVAQVERALSPDAPRQKVEG